MKTMCGFYAVSSFQPARNRRVNGGLNQEIKKAGAHCQFVKLAKTLISCFQPKFLIFETKPRK